MYASYYHRRVSDHPLGARRNQVLPENSISTRAVCEIKEPPPQLVKEPTKPALKPLKEGEDRRTLKGIATIILNAIRFEKAASFRTHGWKREVHGGLKMWVNQITGEVSTEKPWKLDFGTIQEKLPSIKKETKKKKKRLSLTQRLSIIFFGNKENSNNSIPDNNQVKAKEYSDLTVDISRSSSLIQDPKNMDTNEDEEDENEVLSNEMKELFQLFDSEIKKKKP
eukprot:gene4292-4599_t